MTAARLLVQVGGDIFSTCFSVTKLHQMGLSLEQIRQLCWPSPVVEQSLMWATQPGNTLLPQDHPVYPPLLREIPAAPLLLYCRGELSALSIPQLAMVGTCYLTYAGKDNVARLCAAY